MTTDNILTIISTCTDQAVLDDASKLTKILVSLQSQQAAEPSLDYRVAVGREIHLVASRFHREPDNDASDLLVDVLYHVLTDEAAVRMFLAHQIDCTKE
jgi:hypothetical protein